VGEGFADAAVDIHNPVQNIPDLDHDTGLVPGFEGLVGPAGQALEDKGLEPGIGDVGQHDAVFGQVGAGRHGQLAAGLRGPVQVAAGNHEGVKEELAAGFGKAASLQQGGGPHAAGRDHHRPGFNFMDLSPAVNGPDACGRPIGNHNFIAIQAGLQPGAVRHRFHDPLVGFPLGAFLVAAVGIHAVDAALGRIDELVQFVPVIAQFPGRGHDGRGRRPDPVVGQGGHRQLGFYFFGFRRVQVDPERAPFFIGRIPGRGRVEHGGAADGYGSDHHQQVGGDQQPAAEAVEIAAHGFDKGVHGAAGPVVPAPFDDDHFAAGPGQVPGHGGGARAGPHDDHVGRASAIVHADSFSR